MGVALALMLVPRIGLHWRNAAGISWGLLVLLGGGFAMAHGIERSGLSAMIGGSLRDLGGAGPYVSLLACCLVTIAVSEVASNTATASILLPLLGPAAPTFGLHPATLMFAVTLSASFGFMLPAGTPPNAVVFSSGYIPVTRMVRSGVVVDIGGGLVIATVCYFLAPWALGVSR
jgi:sodium-dependent dicarboxylate transporter 2/3/5